MFPPPLLLFPPPLSLSTRAFSHHRDRDTNYDALFSIIFNKNNKLTFYTVKLKTITNKIKNFLKSV
ncbi:unknown [Gryllus bimaculatus nudivirus]|uniref:Uncharacterized protein n=1 Tax=Gryllus bimaculatus nudivirus TaxID=432587 RepID=A4L1Z0_9VIRU|nr:hypothetical protein GrBNV_gp27 [Gryllus bimaculatus nudivirus]ABO45360.1 unknown [Gryllus bimaculatus nudivirus]